MRLTLADGLRTTLHVARHTIAQTRVEVVLLPTPEPLAAWCAGAGVREALVGGFYVRPSRAPLGELRTDGTARAHVPFAAPWGAVRGCVHVQDGVVALAGRDALPAEPAGDLLQAGPLLLADGVPVEGDPEGFSAGARQFDSDITEGRHPRAALGLAAGELLAVACDGRADDEAGLTLTELAGALAAVGATAAINLDGGGSTSLVSGGTLVNTPRGDYAVPIPGGRAITTALVFHPRRGGRPRA